jgi:hypothetical protein
LIGAQGKQMANDLRDATPAMRLTGGCLCGAVRYVASAAPLNVRICHCRMCQKATGQPIFARALFARADVVIEGETRAYASSEYLRRRFCMTCGCPIFAERLRGSDIFLAITLGTLDDPDALTPEAHVWTSSQVCWLGLDDGLHRYSEGAP